MNMNRAQLRDALHQQKFFFRKDIFVPGHVSDSESEEVRLAHPCDDDAVKDSSPCGGTHASPCNGINGSASEDLKKMPSASSLRGDTMLRNCYPDVEEPAVLEKPPVGDEYEEMTINDIINGKVWKQTWSMPLRGLTLCPLGQ